MIKVDITEEEKNNICIELSRLVSELSKDERIKCIYYAPYINTDVDVKFIQVVVVAHGGFDCDMDYRPVFQEYNYLDNDSEIKILLNLDTHVYTYTAMSSSDRLRHLDLYNSTIIYDPTGKYTRIKEHDERFEKKGLLKSFIYNYGNLVELYPPLDDALTTLLSSNTQTDDSSVHILNRKK